MGVVERHPVGGFVQLRYRPSRIRRHHLEAAGLLNDGRDAAFQRLEDRGRGVTTLQVTGCASCGSRDLSIRDLLAAFNAGLPKVRV
jgi:hypothetical protein